MVSCCPKCPNSEILMNILITGACGFVGSTLAVALKESLIASSVTGVDNLIRPGSEGNRRRLGAHGVKFVHADLRVQSDVDSMPKVEWIIDCAANPSVSAGADGRSSSRQLMEHNLAATLNLLEYCKAHGAGLIMLSTSRVYSIEPLAKLEVTAVDGAYELAEAAELPFGLTHDGISEAFSTVPPVSLYGASKLASETLILEYGATFDIPVYVNRCGVLAGAGQFGRVDQGIFAYWLNCHLRQLPLSYIGFDGSGHQVRDCLHPRDLVSLLRKQMSAGLDSKRPKIINVSGGANSGISLRQLTKWCDNRFGVHLVASNPQPRRFDLPWVVLDSGLTKNLWGWQPETTVSQILEEIAAHAEKHGDWIDISMSK